MPFTMKGYPKNGKNLKNQTAKSDRNCECNVKKDILKKMLFRLRRKSEVLVSSVIEEEIKALEEENFVQFHTATMEKAEVDSEYATTDNEEHIQEQSNQDKSYFDSESIGNQSGGVRQREPLMDGAHPKVDHLKTYKTSSSIKHLYLYNGNRCFFALNHFKITSCN